MAASVRRNMLAANRIRRSTPEPEQARTQGLTVGSYFGYDVPITMFARRGHYCVCVDAPDATVAAAGFGAAEVRHLMAKYVGNQNN